MRILLPAHVKRRILREAAASSDGKETGGILLGFGGPGGPCWVTEAAGPGPRAIRSATRFVRDLDHSEAAAEAAFALDGSLWLGDWHTHPGGPAALSAVDLHSYRRVLAASDMGRFLAILVLPGRSGWREPALHGFTVGATQVESVEIVDPLA